MEEAAEGRVGKNGTRIGEFVLYRAGTACDVERRSETTGGTSRMRLRLDPDEVLRRLADFHAAEGALRITEVFADLDAESREFLLTGTTPGEWNALIGSEEEDGA